MSLVEKTTIEIDEEDYLKNELHSDVRHEYVNGMVHAMAGASENHNLISGNIFRELANHLKQKKSECSTFIADMKVKVSHVNTEYYYPDVMVVCDKNDHESEYYKKSPVIIIEVLSQSTRINDSSHKRLSYFNIITLEEYVLVEQEFCQVQVFRRQDGWKASFYVLGDTMTFESIGVSISVEDIYYQVRNKNKNRHPGTFDKRHK